MIQNWIIFACRGHSSLLKVIADERITSSTVKRGQFKRLSYSFYYYSKYYLRPRAKKQHFVLWRTFSKFWTILRIFFKGSKMGHFQSIGQVSHFDVLTRFMCVNQDQLSHVCQPETNRDPLYILGLESSSKICSIWIHHKCLVREVNFRLLTKMVVKP